MYDKADVTAYLYPKSPLSHDLIHLMSTPVAGWIRQYDPEFVTTSSLYEEDDEALASEWMEMVSDAVDDENPGAKALLDKLEAHLMEGANV